MRHRIRTVLLCASLLLVISLSLWLLREPLPWFRGPVFQISEDNLRAILLVSGDYGQRPLDTSEARQAVNLLNDFRYFRTARRGKQVLSVSRSRNWLLLELTNGDTLTVYFDADWLEVQNTVYYGSSGYFSPLLQMREVPA